MRVFLTFIGSILLLCAAIPLSGCDSAQNSEAPVSPTPATVVRPPSQSAPATGSVTPSWEVRLQEDCGPEVSDGHCAAAYGFRVSNDGHFVIGPGPAGQLERGYVSRADLADIQAAVFAVARRSPTPAKPGPGTAPLVVTIDAQTPVAADDDPLQSLLRKALAKYGPEQFPNPCIDANWKLETLYTAAKACKRDADCGYLDRDYLPLDATLETLPPVVVDNCTYVSTLPTANSFLAVEFQRDLILEREAAEAACGDEARNPSCPGERSLNPTPSSPACIAGECALNAPTL